MLKRTNIKDLAKALGLSVATISKALRDSHEISTDTKQRVLEAAARLHYTPNPYASSLRRKKSKTIAVVLPEVADSFFSIAINGIQSVAEKKNYHVLIYLSHEQYINERKIIDECGNGRVDGVLMSVSAQTTDAAHIEQLKNENIPVVFFDRALDTFSAARVITNDFECGEQATNLLIQKGCMRPVFISISNSLPICHKRAAGFTASLTKHNMPCSRRSVVYCTGTDEEIYRQVKTMLQGTKRPDGIVASVERIATVVYRACAELRIHIPGHVKLVAFSNLETAAFLAPSLTTITQPAFEIGKTAADILFRAIEKTNYNPDGEVITLTSTLIERASTG